MKNKLYKFIILTILLFFNTNLKGEELVIDASQIQLNNENKIVYAEGSVQISDTNKNIIFTEKAEYDKTNEIVRSFGSTDIVTSEKYRIQGEDIFYDNSKKSYLFQ